MSETRLAHEDMLNAGYKQVEAQHINESAVQLIGYDWMLITAGTIEKQNTMSASWGGLGVLWNKPVAYVFIRPVRHTYSFVEAQQYFTCSFYDKKYRKMLNYCGKFSGRDVNKVKEMSLTPINTGKSLAFAEARIILECKKLYTHDIDPTNFLNTGIARHYPDADYHRMYIAEITGAWVKHDNY